MALESIASAATLGLVIWALCFLVPRARREKDGFGLTVAVLTALVGFLAWALIGVRVR